MESTAPRIASAVFHLGDHVQKNRRMGGAMSEDQMNKICETIEQLNILPLGYSPIVFWVVGCWPTGYFFLENMAFFKQHLTYLLKACHFLDFSLVIFPAFSRLDLEQPFTVKVKDPQGVSEFKPFNGVVTASWDPES